MVSLTHDKNISYRNRGFKIGKGCRLFGDIDVHYKSVSLGDYVTVGGGTYIITHCPVNGYSEESLNINIEHDVYIGYGSIILPGTLIKKCTIIGAGSVVKGELKEYSIYAGNPCKFIKSRNPIEILKTRLYTMQNMTCVPSDVPRWDVSGTLLSELFGHLYRNNIKLFDFMYDKDFCYKYLRSSTITCDIKDYIKYFNMLYNKQQCGV